MTQGIEFIGKINPRLINVVLFLFGAQKHSFDNPVQRTRDPLMKHLSSVRMYGVKFSLPLLSDIHLISQLQPENITLHFTSQYDKEMYTWKILEVDGCPNAVSYPSALRPLIHRSTRVDLASHPEIGLVLHRDQMRFVSCHKEQNQWIHQIKELVLAFDISTWITLFLSFLLTAYIHAHAYDNLDKNKLYAVGDMCFSFITSLMDQSNKLFQTPSFRYLVISWPLVFVILSNEYKGENITRLTLEPSLVPFNTFASLKQNNFTTYSRHVEITNDIYSHVKMNSGLEGFYVEYSAHEFYPIVSELWYAVFARFTLPQLNTLELLMPKLSNETQMYLNYSKMLPQWKTKSGGYGFYETVEEVFEMHMESCDKSAIIGDENFAIQMFTVLKAIKKPAYLGQDVLNENLLGYKYYGYFPQNIMRRVKYYFQTGIVNWWGKYFKWVVALKTEREYQTIVIGQNITNTANSKAGIYILSVIPGIGLLLSLFVFIFLDSPIINLSLNFSWKTTVSKLLRNPALYNEQICCPFCDNVNQNTTFMSTSGLKDHLTNIHTECYFLTRMIPQQKLYRFHNLSNLVLNGELGSTVSCDEASNCNKEIKIRCPYNCSNFENMQAFKNHLLEYHKDIMLEKLNNILRLENE